MTTATDSSSEDPLVTKYVEAAIDPYRDDFTAEELEVYRARLCLYYENDPQAVALLDEIRQEAQKAPVVGRSGEQTKPDDAAMERAVERKTGGARRGGQ